MTALPNQHRTTGRAVSNAITGTWPVALIVTTCAIIAAGGDGWFRALRYDRTAILHGEWWRLLTGNLVHLGTGHLLMDMGGLVVLWLLCRPVLAGWRWMAATVGGMLSVGLGLLVLSPAIAWYVGFSGVLETYWIIGALFLLLRRDALGGLLLAALAAKLTWEQTVGPVPFTEVATGGAVIVDAHLWGACGGLVLAFLLYVTTRPRTANRTRSR